VESVVDDWGGGIGLEKASAVSRVPTMTDRFRWRATAPNQAADYANLVRMWRVLEAWRGVTADGVGERRARAQVAALEARQLEG